MPRVGRKPPAPLGGARGPCDPSLYVLLCQGGVLGETVSASPARLSVVLPCGGSVPLVLSECSASIMLYVLWKGVHLSPYSSVASYPLNMFLNPLPEFFRYVFISDAKICSFVFFPQSFYFIYFSCFFFFGVNNEVNGGHLLFILGIHSVTIYSTFAVEQMLWALETQMRPSFRLHRKVSKRRRGGVKMCPREAGYGRTLENNRSLP